MRQVWGKEKKTRAVKGRVLEEASWLKLSSTEPSNGSLSRANDRARQTEWFRQLTEAKLDW
jgi:hypothetical protein